MVILGFVTYQCYQVLRMRTRDVELAYSVRRFIIHTNNTRSRQARVQACVSKCIACTNLHIYCCCTSISSTAYTALNYKRAVDHTATQDCTRQSPLLWAAPTVWNKLPISYIAICRQFKNFYNRAEDALVPLFHGLDLTSAPPIDTASAEFGAIKNILLYYITFSIITLTP